MTFNPVFLDTEEVLYFHHEEIRHTGSSLQVCYISSLESALSAPKAIFSGEYLMDLFEMAATYVNSICFNHPFLDGNKRTAAVTALAFLYINGYEFEEQYDEELADKILALIIKKISKNDLAEYFRKRCKKIT